ncbi:MAG: hypothetical protein PUE01_10900 [Clostridiaceae bacterium]|nr:hypothetical protein [Clostridiaceae bacterium]
MELYIYKTFNDWYKDKATEVLEGNINVLYNGLISIGTVIDGKNYRQIFSTKNNFAILYKLPCGFLSSTREINVYAEESSWRKSKPEITLYGQVCEDECSEGRCVFITEDGYKQYISLDGVYSVTYER